MPIFVVQEHWATHHHFDFRLELDNTLRSWAVPKEIPVRAGIRRLAVAVEDHPISYADFEGTIPKGSYGAGKVSIWDKGRYEMVERSEGMLKFRLFGKKLKGSYALIKFRGEKDWLLIKEKI